MKHSISKLLNLGALAALALLGLAVAATWHLTWRIEREVAQAYSDQLHAMQTLAEAESTLWRLRYGFDQYLHGDADARQRLRVDDPRWVRQLDELLNAYAVHSHGTDEAQALAELRAVWTRYREARPKFFELVDAGKPDEAQAWRSLTTTPYGAATVNAIERQIDKEHIGDDMVRTHAQDVMRQARWVSLAISITLLVLLALGYTLARRTLTPLVQLRARTSRLLHELLGDTAARDSETAQANEVQGLQVSFERLVEGFSLHVAELDEAQQQLTGQQLALETTVAERTAELRKVLAETERQAAETRLRGELGDMLQSCQNVREAARVVERYLPQLFPRAAGALYLSDEHHELMGLVAHWHVSVTDEATGTPYAPDLRPSFEYADCWGLRRGKTYFIDRNESSLLCNHLTAPLVGASLCVPLSAHGQTIGLLHLLCARCDNADGVDHCCLRMELAESVAALLGMAIATLRMGETLRQQTIRDTLTGLYNRRHLEATLPRELSRAARGTRPLAVIMLDVDHFKHFNDTHGHEAGDAVLRALGKALRDNCRQADTACRFGGEEFTVLLPETDEAAAREWGHRLRQRLAILEVRVNTQLLPRVTVSAGLALYPEHGMDAETLLQAADLALYDAKHAGRDRLMVSGEAAAQPDTVSP